MKRGIILFFAIFMVFQIAEAQNTGHLGKRFLINLDGTFSPSYRHPDFNGYHGYLNFNYRVSPSIEFVLNKRSSVGLLYSNALLLFMPSTFIFNHSILNTPLNVNGYGLFYKVYFSNKDNHAPYGSYFMMSASKLYYQYESLIVGNGTGSNYAFQLEMGYNYLLFNRLRLTWGITIGGTTSWYYFDFDKDFFPNQKQLNTINDHAENRIFGTYMFGTKIGIGFLAF